MNRRPILYIIYALLLVFVLAGCARKEQQQEAAEISGPVAGVSGLSVEDADSDVPDAEDDGYQTLIIDGEVIKWDGYKAVEPSDDWDIRSMKLSDVGPFFEEVFEVENSSYKLMEGTLMETEVFHIHSANEGPCVYVVGAVHGDERAAWYAALLLRVLVVSEKSHFQEIVCVAAPIWKAAGSSPGA